MAENPVLKPSEGYPAAITITNDEMRFAGACPFLTCLITRPHAHPACPDCGAARYGNWSCATCRARRGTDMNPHRLLPQGGTP